MSALDIFFLIASYAGMILLISRMWPRKTVDKIYSGDWPRVSIIVPARNEEKNLARLLPSLQGLLYPDFEVIVVDDQSKDATAQISQNYHVKLVRGQPKPLDWSGKQWACWQGASAANGEILLFTDADTVHLPTGLSRMVAFALQNNADMVSTFPWHEGVCFWEKILGGFHILLLSLTAPYSKPRAKRVYAIGQYLMVTRSFYQRLGGHEVVKDKFVEDLPLANACLKSLGHFAVYTGDPVFKVRMYETFAQFVSGWRRNFRAGLNYSSKWAPVEVVLMMCAFSGAPNFAKNYLSLIPMLISVVFVAWRQTKLGNFSLFGVVLLPFSLAVFSFVTMLSVFDMLFKRQLVWKERRYASN